MKSIQPAHRPEDRCPRGRTSRRWHHAAQERSTPLLALCLVAVLLGPAVLAQTPDASTETSSSRRIVAIGDIHGAYDNLIAILEQAELIDRRHRWDGGDSILVQTGDFIDRGADSVKVARFLEKLQKQASKQGGEVVVLLGNHEVLNLIGDLRYVTRDILQAYVDQRSEARHTFYCSDYAKHLRRKVALRGDEPVPTQREMVSKCQSQKVLGLLEYIDALGPDGELGSWIRTLPAAAQIDDVIFLHGGISPKYAGKSPEELNRRVAEEIADYDTARAYLLGRHDILPTSHLRDVLATARDLANKFEAEGRPVPAQVVPLLDFEDSLLAGSDGPFWFRGYANWTEREGKKELPDILEPLGARHLVVGHTPQESHDIVTRFDNRVFLVDTGMLTTYYKGRPSALEFDNGRIRALYVGESPTVLVEPTAGN